MDNRIAILFDRSVYVSNTIIDAVKIKIAEPPFMFGPTEDRLLKVISYELSTTNVDNDTLILTTSESFQNASGDISVIYDATVDAIYSNGKYLESGTFSFTPDGLSPNIPSNAREWISVGVSPKVILMPIIAHNIDSQNNNYISVRVNSNAILNRLFDEKVDTQDGNSVSINVKAMASLIDLGTIVP